MLEINRLVSVVFSGLSGLVIDDVTDEGEWIRVRARSRQVPVPCPGCAVQTAQVHAWCERVVADVPVGGRPVVVNVRLRRFTCRDWRCPRRTFREQVSGVLERYQRRTTRLTAQVSALVRELAGRASARVLPALGIVMSRHTALRALLGIPLPPVVTPRVLGVLCERGRRGLPLERLYRQLFNPQLYLLAYGRIYSTKGAMTPGATGETVEGMSVGKIEAIIEGDWSAA